MADMTDLADFMDSFLSRNAAAYLANALAVRAAQAITDDLAVITPADVGDALSNWQVTLNAPAAKVVPAYAPSPKGSVVHGQWVHKVPPALTVAANAPQVIARAKAVLAAKRPGEPIFITNNAEYITELNQGSSTQAPADFVGRATIVGEKAIQQALSVINVQNVTP
jgi:hypothetical protein